MKYTILTKKIDELDISDFDEEVLDQYKNFSVTPESVSYTVDGKKVMGTKESLLQDMCNKQIELIFDSFAERVAKKMHEALEKSQNCVKCKHYFHCCNVDEEYEHDCFEPESQKRGKWIDVSERGSWATKNACDQCSEIVFQPNYNYCPNCGAKMR